MEKAREVTFRMLVETDDKDKVWEIIQRAERIVKATDTLVSACWVTADGVQETNLAILERCVKEEHLND